MVATPQNSMVFVDPMTFPEGVITVMLCNDFQGALGWFIKWFDKGNYCHATIMRKTGFVCSQNEMYQEVPVQNYMTTSEGLKFWRINNLTADEFTLINNKITSDLNSPWWNRCYNYLGLIGQALHLPWISMPGQDICSQRVAEYLRLLPRFQWLTPNPSPAELDGIFISRPDLMNCIGYFWTD